MQAWAEDSKLANVTGYNTIDSDLEQIVTIEVFAQIQTMFDTSTWLDETTTPALVQTILSMMYVSTLLQRVYVTDEEVVSYATRLNKWATNTITSLLQGDTLLVDQGTTGQTISDTQSAPVFFPTDLSSSTPTDNCNDLDVTAESDGDVAFTMGAVF
jgi:hypothetical protein